MSQCPCFVGTPIFVSDICFGAIEPLKPLIRIICIPLLHIGQTSPGSSRTEPQVRFSVFNTETCRCQGRVQSYLLSYDWIPRDRSVTLGETNRLDPSGGTPWTRTKRPTHHRRSKSGLANTSTKVVRSQRQAPQVPQYRVPWSGHLTSKPSLYTSRIHLSHRR